MSKKNVRIAVINKDKCKPTKCNFECGLICPVNRQGKECISLSDIEDINKSVPIITTGKKKIASIVESACIGCGLCAKAPEHGGCPFGAITIVNVPTELSDDIINRYGRNGFRLYRMPILKQNKILGFIGQNGIGKSTIVQILSGKMKPNFEDFDTKCELNMDAIINKFKGNEMHKYMSKLYKNELKISIKPQHVDSLIPFLKSKNLDYSVDEYLMLKSGYSTDESWYEDVITTLELNSILKSKVITLSGGELQRLLCAVTLLTNADVYIFDEPTNYLDVKQRLNIAKLIRKLTKEITEGSNKQGLLLGAEMFSHKTSSEPYIAIIEHDLSILDYISDYVCILYGQPGAYGIVSKPLNTAQGINMYFDGYIPGENMRFRQSEYSNMTLNISEGVDIKYSNTKLSYKQTILTYTGFELYVQKGYFPTEGSISVVMGRNGTGKTTFINNIAKELMSSVSHKPQYLSVDQFKNSDGSYPTVFEFLINNIKESYTNELFKSDVVRPLNIDSIKERYLNELSGGEMQRFWIVYCLGKDAHVYLLDEPSACLDIEQRVVVTKIIKRFMMHNRKVAFIVEHDMMMAVSLGCEQNSQAIIVEQKEIDDGIRHCIAKSPVSFTDGINEFLKSLGITFHTQSRSAHQRPRINKLDSVKDREQKSKGKYYE
jgi:ATP-binding cassette subfamily E protein 1